MQNNQNNNQNKNQQNSQNKNQQNNQNQNNNKAQNKNNQDQCRSAGYKLTEPLQPQRLFFHGKETQYA